MAAGFKTGGRQKGTPNKKAGFLRDQITEALERAGGIEWLVSLAQNKPEAFASLLGRVLPMQLTGENGGPVIIKWNDS